MPESRDRLTRQEYDVVAAYSQRRIANTSNRDRDISRGSPVIFVMEEDDEENQTHQTPFRWRGTTMVGTPRPIRVGIVRGNFGTPRIGRFAPITGLENMSPLAGSGRGRGSPLPSWYPRRPLNDITSVMRAIERRRDSHPRRGDRILRIESSITIRDRIFHDPSASGFKTPRPTKPSVQSIDKVSKILQDVTQHYQQGSDGGDKECNLTPQKKLLNSLDTVDKVVKEELRKLKRTPSAKRVEREKRVRTLMSMR